MIRLVFPLCITLVSFASRQGISGSVSKRLLPLIICGALSFTHFLIILFKKGSSELLWKQCRCIWCMFSYLLETILDRDYIFIWFYSYWEMFTEQSSTEELCWELCLFLWWHVTLSPGHLLAEESRQSGALAPAGSWWSPSLCRKWLTNFSIVKWTLCI